MNNKQIRREFKDGVLHGAYCFRDWDDPDDDGTPILRAEIPAESLDDKLANKKLKSELASAYDRWNNTEKYL